MTPLLPDSYCERMQRLLSGEYLSYCDSFSEPAHCAVRVNTAKISLEQWREKQLFSDRAVPWSKKGFYYDGASELPAKHPYYFAGLYYIQEPSAMLPAALLPVEAGDYVLDLCAAPGGKATELGAKLNQTGLLVANDISVSRTAALAKNIQLAGITNSVVTAETPQRLAQRLGSFFDKILVDAPCSGEGMFRRNPRMIKAWQEKGPAYYAPLQKEILTEAYRLLRPGGKMVYSTCTFSVEEDEGVVQWFLQEHADMSVCEVAPCEGFSEGYTTLSGQTDDRLRQCIRIFPHRAPGEGHFAAVLQKEGEKEAKSQPDRKKKKTKALSDMAQEFWEQLPLAGRDADRQIETVGARQVWQVNEIERFSGLRVVYSGLPLWEEKKKLLPTPQLALTLTAEEFAASLNLTADDERVIRYLKGETVFADTEKKGTLLFCVDGYGLGWCQSNGQGMLKNKYHPGWRYQ